MYNIKIEKDLGNNPSAEQIRNNVFVKEQGFTDEFDDIDKYAFHLVVFENDTPLATGRTFPKENEPQTYIIGRIAVEKEFRKQQLGRLLMEELESFAQVKGASFTELSAQVQAKGFYEKMGYMAFGEEYFEEFCPHIKMRKKL